MALNKLGNDYQLAPWLVRLMELFSPKLCHPGYSPVTVSLYRNEHWCDPQDLHIDENLNLRSYTPMEMCHTYHVRLSLLTDLTLLSERTLNRLICHGKECQALLAALGPDLYDELPELLTTGSIKKNDFWSFISKLRDTNSMYKNGVEIKRFSVASCVIQIEETKNATPRASRGASRATRA